MFDVLRHIEELMELRGWTNYRLSKLSGIPLSTIATWRKCKMSPRIDKVEDICSAFGITLSEFFKTEADENTKALSDEESDLLARWSGLSPAEKNAVNVVINTFNSRRHH